MTVTEKQHKNDNYYISLEIKQENGNNYYSVQVCPIYGDYCGYPVKEMIYPIMEKDKALATFNRYKRKYK